MSRLFLLLLLLPLGLCAQSLSNEQIAKVGFEQKLGAELPLDLPFTDERGETARFGRWLSEKPTVLVFAYHDCPALCSIVLTSLVESLRNLRLEAGRDFDVTVVSIHPGETPAQSAQSKQRYVQRYGRYGSDSGWHFLTGSASSIGGLAGAAGFHFVPDEKSGQYAHASGIMVLTPGGRVSKYFPGIEYPPRELQAALKDARGETIGTRVRDLLLLCFHYAPITGRYGWIIQIGLRASGLGTVLALIGGIWLANRRHAV